MRVVALAVLLLVALSVHGEPPPPGPTPPAVAEAPAAGDVVILPLHAHVLSAPGRADIDCQLTDEDLARILGKVNRVWRQAGVQFAITIHREPAADLDLFDRLRAAVPPEFLGIYRALAPPATRHLPGLHVYYVHELPPNGVYLGDNICFVKETAALRPVEGGIDEPLPRVTSHEIGHALGLPHRQNETNLMASGTTGSTFNDEEVKTAQTKAREIEGALTVEEAEQAAEEAEKAGDEAGAEAMRAAVAGAGASENGARETTHAPKSFVVHRPEYGGSRGYVTRSQQAVQFRLPVEPKEKDLD